MPRVRMIPKTQKKAKHPFCKIRRAWIAEYGDYSQYLSTRREVLDATTEAEAIREAAEMSEMHERDVTVGGDDE